MPLGTLVCLDTTLPDGSDFQRLMVAQDTGGAIAGHVRADVFFGTGDRAERLAGEMKQQGSMFALLICRWLVCFWAALLKNDIFNPLAISNTVFMYREQDSVIEPGISLSLIHI